MKFFLQSFLLSFVFFFSFLYSINIALAGTATCSTGQYCDPTWSSLECQSGSDYVCDCGNKEAICVPAGSWECDHAWNGSSISCDSGTRCECGNDNSPPNPPPPPPDYPNTYPNSYPESYPPQYNSYQDYPSYPQYNNYPSYPQYNNYPDYPSYPSYNNYPSYPSYNSYNSYNNYPAYNNYPTYNTYNSYPQTFSLTVVKTSGGNVKSVDGFINCGTTCVKADYTSGTSVTLKATPNSSYWKFNGWSGDCSGTGDCVLNMTGTKNVTGRFIPRAFIYKEF